MDAITIQGLTKTYYKKGSTPFNAVNDITLSIDQGQLFGFLGPNGAGKTTTIKMICGLISQTHGTILINGIDTQQDRLSAMRTIGAVLEGSRNIYWQFSALENLAYFARLKGASGSIVTERATQLLHTLKLWERRHDPVGSFSRGMQQKVAIACALIADPPIILLDEPTLGLDIQSAHTVKALIRDLVHTHKKTVILTTHQLDIAEDLCERIAIIRAGRIIMDKSISDLLHLFNEEIYTITVEGNISSPLPHQELLSLKVDGPLTIITATFSNQDMLHAVLQALGAMKKTLTNVSKSKHSLEQVFIKLLEEQKA